MSMVDICICTFRRAHIRETLRSIAALHDVQDIRVIVADNDDTPSAKTLVEDSARDFGLTINYIHAPARNISVARNACLDAASAPLIAFIDDDEIAMPGWLSSLRGIMQSTAADIVLGPVNALYSGKVPRWARSGDYHSTRPVFIGEKIVTGYTCNVLFRRDTPEFSGLRFRIELGKSGGEDTAFFSEAVRKGARIAYAPDAIVIEDVTPERARFSWLLKRRFRAGQTHATLLMEEPQASRLKNFIKAAAKAGFCFCLGLVLIFSIRQWTLRGALHVGVMAGLIGHSTIEQYG